MEDRICQIVYGNVHIMFWKCFLPHQMEHRMRSGNVHINDSFSGNVFYHIKCKTESLKSCYGNVHIMFWKCDLPHQIEHRMRPGNVHINDSCSGNVFYLIKWKT